MKAAVVDRRVAYVGSSNLTRSSETNRESVVKVKGLLVAEVLSAINDCIGSV